MSESLARETPVFELEVIATDIAFEIRVNDLPVLRMPAGRIQTVFDVNPSVVDGDNTLSLTVKPRTRGRDFSENATCKVELRRRPSPDSEASETIGTLVFSGYGTSAVTGRLPFQRGFPWAVLATPNGGFTVFDSTIERLIVQFTSSTLPAVVLNAVDISMAMGTPPNQQRAAVLSADGRHLFVVSQEDAVIHEYALSATGVIDGASRRPYATLATSSFPRSLAFDECGNLYVNGTVVPTVGASTGMLWRIPAGGGPHVPLATIDPVDSHRVIAFGAGPGFSNTHLYVADVHSQLVRRINVGIPGQPVVTPR